ncbi:MAG: class I SAM-dependent methyltransferase [Chloroflexi bacterium]|nr:class I SAM-dependent methyltransferase [Chloroflexota bacterium]
MHLVHCNFCKRNDASLLFTGRDLLHGIPGSFDLVRCNHCGLIYLNPQPSVDELAPYYPEDYEAHVGTRKEQLGWLRRLDYRYGVEKRYRAISRYIQTGRILDIGCATGAFLDGVRAHGWQVEGIEPGVRAAAYAQEELGIPVQNTSLEEAQLKSESLDVVTMWNVLEHLSDPQTALIKISRALRPGGILVFAVPNILSYDHKLFQSYWAGYDTPRHLYVFPPPVLEVMLARAGLELAERRCIYGTYNAFVYSARFAMMDRIASQTTRSRLTQLLQAIPVRIMMMPLSRVVDLLNRGSIMTWFCRKVAAS